MSSNTLTNAALHSTPASHHRFHFLDALRCIAAVLVVFWHAPNGLHLKGSTRIYLAVDFFFCLSGFVIAFSYEHRLEAKLSFARFVLTRAIRLYPIYLLGVVIGGIIFLASGIDVPLNAVNLARLVALFCFQLAMLPNLHIWYTNVLFPLDFPGWSMFYEVVANVGYALLVCKRLASNRIVIGITLVSCLLLVACAILRGTVDVGIRNRLLDFLGFARVGLSFFAGVVAMRLYRALPRPVWPPFVQAMVALIILASVPLLLLAPFALMRNRVFLLLTISGLFPALVYLGALTRLPAVFSGICATLGNLSYPIYMLHISCLTVLKTAWARPFAQAHPILSVTGVVLGTALVSQLALTFYDAPLRSYLTRKFNASTSPKPVTA